jgi:hypothetical protein
MPSSDTLERFIARVEEGAHAEAIAEFYVEQGAIRENLAAPRIGRSDLIAHERKVLGRARSVHTTCVRPWFVNRSHAVVRWIFRFEWLDGSITTLHELSWQTWDGERLVEEQFFYDPAQLVPLPGEPVPHQGSL